MRNFLSSLRSATILPALFLLGPCTTEKIVEVEKPAYNPPADAASGFVGYYEAAELAHFFEETLIRRPLDALEYTTPTRM